MNGAVEKNNGPAILAPAGNRACFLAALAAGADAVYCGLKAFSARMEAKNFSIPALGALTQLAHQRGTKVFVALNSLLKPDDLDAAGTLIAELNRRVGPDALIIQDLALVALARQTGFSGQIHLSTLANATFAAALALIRQKLDIDRVVLPRELNIDEIKTLSRACPPGLELEVFIHGALCYGVSGRCYWSSYLGGKSGLRGRCVQPCRRLYRYNNQTQRYFACQDLSLDVLVKVLATVPRVRTWKIEGRKKGPHYVYYTVRAYRMLRDGRGDSKMKKSALELLDRALGRTGTHYNFLPQRAQNPVSLEGQTGSGLLVGRIKGSRQRPFFVPREQLLPGDVLRLGYEDAPGHRIERIARHVPAGGRFALRASARRGPARGTPVFLTDRREKALGQMITELEEHLAQEPAERTGGASFRARLPAGFRQGKRAQELHVYRKSGAPGAGGRHGLWLSARTLAAGSGRRAAGVWWWLPPVVWPEQEAEIGSQVDQACRRGGRNFVLNAAWQIAFFKNRKKLNLWAGPFCNLTNPLALAAMKTLGFSGAVVSPELGQRDYLQLPRHSPLALGILLAGHWPLCVSRAVAGRLPDGALFTSPKGEQAWAVRHGPDVWLYPNWKLDLEAHKNELQKAGYTLFVHLIEPPPKGVKMKKRPGLWNWELGLK